MGRSGAAVWGIALICAPETSARKQKARGDVDVCNFEKDFFSVLAALGLNIYLRDKGAEGWDGARRRILPRGSCEILRSRLIDMKLKLGTHLDGSAS